jgi:glycosyltransferase involved in cell wall biosynthesis
MRLQNKKLSIIIPVYNEERTIEKIINLVSEADVLGLEKEIIVVNDGSTDSTKEILTGLKNKFDFVLINLAENRGKGAAVKAGLERASGDLAVIQDADLEYSPDDYKNLLREWNREFPVIYGSRMIDKAKRKIGYFHYFLGAKMLNFLINLLFHSNLTDAYTCYKLFSADIIKNISLESRGFEFEAEITTKILKKGIKIKETAVSYQPRTFKEGKKIRIKDALIGFFVVLKNRFK